MVRDLTRTSQTGGGGGYWANQADVGSDVGYWWVG